MYDHDEELNLPTDASRKDIPVWSGCIAIFPLAIAAIARVSHKGTARHKTKGGWDRSKSPDDLNSLARHMLDFGRLDDDGESHLAHGAWRILAALQKEEEARLKNDRSVPRRANAVPRPRKSSMKNGAGSGKRQDRARSKA